MTAAQLPASVPLLTANGNLLVSPAQGNMIDPNAQQSTLAGGYANIMGNDYYAVIGGGILNQIGAGGEGSVIPGGAYNIIGPGIDFAFAAGYQAQAIYSGDFVWADFHNAPFTATAPNQFLIRAGGGVGINTNNPGTNALAVVGSVSASTFIGDGSGLTGINFNSTNLNYNASLVTSGTLADARLSANVPVLDTNSSLAVDQADGNSVATSYNSTVAGGFTDTINNSFNSFIGGGFRNIILNGSYSFIGGGLRNTNSGYYSFIGGGRTNVIGANAYYAMIPGGLNNAVGANSLYSFAAGFNAQANYSGDFVWADSQNAPFASTAANQFLIRASGGVGIGTANPITSVGYPSSWTGLHLSSGAGNNGVGIIEGGVSARLHLRNDGGITNTTQDFVIDSGNGDNNVDFRWLGSGLANRVNIMSFDQTGRVGIGTTTPGENLTIAGVATYDSGLKVTGNSVSGVGMSIENLTTGGHKYALFSSGVGYSVPVGGFGIYDETRNGYDLVLAANGYVGIGGTTTPATSLDVAGEITCTALNVTSDRNVKEEFKHVDARAVLEKVTRLTITEWQYTTQPDARHIGPMAQDFHEAFSLGRDDKHITTVDEEGVALAAIQGLNQKLEEQSRDKDDRIQELEKSITELKKLVSELASQQNGGGR